MDNFSSDDEKASDAEDFAELSDDELDNLNEETNDSSSSDMNMETENNEDNGLATAPLSSKTSALVPPPPESLQTQLPPLIIASIKEEPIEDNADIKGKEKADQHKEKEKDIEREIKLESTDVKEQQQKNGVQIPLKLKAVFSGSATEITPSIKQVCSSLTAANGPILKFSEIFAPPARIRAARPRRAKYSRQRERFREEKEDEDIFWEEDDEEVFTTLKHTFLLSRAEDAEETTEATGETSLIAKRDEAFEADVTAAQPLRSKNELNAGHGLRPDLPLAAFDLVYQSPWEKDIIWDDVDEHLKMAKSSSPMQIETSGNRKKESLTKSALASSIEEGDSMYQMNDFYCLDTDQTRYFSINKFLCLPSPSCAYVSFQGYCTFLPRMSNSAGCVFIGGAVSKLQ